LLQDNGVEPEIIEYLQSVPSVAEIGELLNKLGIEARDLLRKGEEEYRENGLGNPELSSSQLIEAMAAHPRLIERPIVVCGNSAVIGRPPENVLGLLK
jgi:arsenate reductase